MPHPNLRVLGPNVKFFADHNVKGIFEQGAYGPDGAEMAELRAWVLAKLLWDPSRDGEALTNEFIDGYYGPAAPHIKAYLKVTHDAVEASGDWLGCFEESTPSSSRSTRSLAAGNASKPPRQAVTGQSRAAIPRPGGASLPVMYTFVMRWNEMREAAKTASAEWPMLSTRQRYLRSVPDHRQEERTSRV